MTPQKLILLLIFAIALFPELDAQTSDDTQSQIKEKRQSIKKLISKIRARLEKKQKSGKSDKSDKSARMVQSIDCATSNIQGVDTCCSSLNKTLYLALNTKRCDLLELKADQSFPVSTYAKYSLNSLQELDSNKLSLASLSNTIKEQICASECLIRGIRSNARQMEILPLGKKGKTYSPEKMFKAALDECKTLTKDYQKTTVDFNAKKCSVAPYLQLQCAIRKSILECTSFSNDDLCLGQQEQLHLCDPFKF